MKRIDFITGLKELGFEPDDKGNDFVVFPYEIRVGKFAGQSIKLGLQVKDMNPPGGPHISPRLLPLNPAAVPHPVGGVHGSPLGDDWQYWSRPYKNWNLTDRSARSYMAHITKIFDTQ